MNRHHSRHRLMATLAAVGSAAVVLFSACTDKADKVTASANGPGVLKVVSTDKACTISSNEAPSGNLTFSVQNKGSQVTEFYVFAADGLRIVGEVENIGPGITRKLVMRAKPGSYKTACKSGLLGDGIQAPFTVTDSGSASADSPAVEALLTDATKQ